MSSYTPQAVARLLYGTERTNQQVNTESMPRQSGNRKIKRTQARNRQKGSSSARSTSVDQGTANADDQSVLRPEFHGTIVIADRDTALKAARAEYTNFALGRRMVAWCDGSIRSSRNSGFGIAYKSSPDDWSKKSWHIGNHVKNVNIDVVELAATCKALEYAHEDSKHMKEKPDCVIIYSDSQNALLRFSRLARQELECQKSERQDLAYSSLRRGIAATDKMVDRGIRVELHWVPGHENVRGNEEADSAASVGSGWKGKKRQKSVLLEIGGSKRPIPFVTNS